MTSTINTNGLDVNYPIPGKNNSSQGFRNNFTNIKDNLVVAGEEITEIQNKVVVKEGLTGIPIDNDMANTLISNAAIQSFRHTTYNLGSSLSGTVLVNALNGDVQYGTVSANTTINFAGWAPTNTESTIKLRLSFANTSASITFPSEVDFSENLIENSNSDINPTGNLVVLKPPYDADYLEYNFTTLDCGNSITIQPTNRPYKTTQIVTRPLIPPTGFEGDRNGDIAVDNFVQPVNVTESAMTTNIFSTTSTTDFYINMPVQFSGNVFGGIQAGTTYYISYIDTDTSFAVSLTEGGSNIALSSATGLMEAIPLAYLYTCTGTYDSVDATANVSLSTASSNSVTLGAPIDILYTPYYALNHPVIFTDLSDGANVALMGLDASTVYFVKSILTDGSEFTLTRTRTNGIADGPTVEVTSTTPSQVSATFYTQGHDIWKKIPLTVDGSSSGMTGDIALASLANLTIGGGTNGYFLQTDGSGVLSWAAGGGSGNGTVGGSNTQIQFNNSGSFAGSSNLTFDTSTGILDLTGTLSVTGNVISTVSMYTANLTSTNALTANLVNAQLVNINGNLNANNVTATNGDVTASANVVANVEVSAPAGNITTLQSDVIGATSLSAGSLIVPSYDPTNVAPVLNVTTSVDATTPGFVALSTETGIQAVGTVAGDAYPLIAHINEVNNYVTLNTNGVSLPKAYAGLEITVNNTSNANIKVYGNTLDGTQSLGNLQTSRIAKFTATSGNSTVAGTWYVTSVYGPTNTVG